MINSKIDIRKYESYFPKCNIHGTMSQVLNRNHGYRWSCQDKKCKVEVFGLSNNQLVNLINDSNVFDVRIDELERKKILKQLNYVPQIQRSKISLLIAALYDNEITFRTDWKKTLLLILDKIENLELNEQNEIDELNKKRIRLEEMEYNNIRICRVCGLSSCNNLNNCMDVSD